MVVATEVAVEDAVLASAPKVTSEEDVIEDVPAELLVVLLNPLATADEAAADEVNGMTELEVFCAILLVVEAAI